MNAPVGRTGGSALTCARARVLLESYIDGDLASERAEVARDLREHLAACTDCRRQHDQAASLPHRLKALSSPPPRESLTRDVMRAVTPVRARSRGAWSLLLPEAALVAFILWYLSGLDGLTVLASGVFGDLQRLAGWGSGSGPLPRVPSVDVLLLLAVIALTAIAAYHLSILIRLAPRAVPGRRAARE
jgi:predicted anti-sigma-YlaC factor YlaD